jgi:uncharacterized membrane protein YkoI
MDKIASQGASMRFNHLLITGALCALAAPAALAHARPAHGDPALAAQAALSVDKARKIALTARPGAIKKWELERERGGSGLRYSFDIATQGRIYEVGVDARDGAVLENGRETD